MFERMTERSRAVLMLALEEARQLDHNVIGTEHLLMGMLREGEGVAAQVLQSLGVELETFRQRIVDTVLPVYVGSPDEGRRQSPPFTPRAKKVLELSLREALQLGHTFIGTEHLLLGMVREGEGVAMQMLASLGVEGARIRQGVIQLLSTRQGQESRETSAARPIRSEPTCHGCGSDLASAARYRAMEIPPATSTVSPASTTSEPPSIAVNAVFCGRCGRLLEMIPKP
jgi:ATP-dependent Clp protease ATP-binding subunit ClpC